VCSCVEAVEGSYDLNLVFPGAEQPHVREFPHSAAERR
jgi:hypothetical protein